MFTGIVEELGVLRSTREGPVSRILSIGCKTVLERTKCGDSIAVNGVCLTVTSLSAAGFSADVMHESLNRSTLGLLKSGQSVNLERAMPADGRFGGHFVTGHIDGRGTIASVRPDGAAIWYTVRCPPAILRLIAEKGSIAIDGISLTVATLDTDRFAVSIIPHTAGHTTLLQRRAGDPVNLEADCVARYLDRLLHPAPLPSTQSHLTAERLAAIGF